MIVAEALRAQGEELLEAEGEAEHLIRTVAVTLPHHQASRPSARKEPLP
jgi:hypothetical protein